MWQQANDGVTYLLSQSGEGLLQMFWFVIIFEFPRYTLGFIAAALSVAASRKTPTHVNLGRLSVLIAGHNEGSSIERCISALHEQSRPPDEIIVVSDGSTDLMPAKLRRLQQLGMIHEAHCTQVRGGKSAALNLAIGRAKGDIIVIVDCDCTLDRHALREITAPFADPKVAAVAGNVVVRNPTASLEQISLTPCPASQERLELFGARPWRASEASTPAAEKTST